MNPIRILEYLSRHSAVLPFLPLFLPGRSTDRADALESMPRLLGLEHASELFLNRLLKLQAQTVPLPLATLLWSRLLFLSGFKPFRPVAAIEVVFFVCWDSVLGSRRRKLLRGRHSIGP